MSHYTIVVSCPRCAEPIITETDVYHTRKGTITCDAVLGGYERQRSCECSFTEQESDALDEAIWEAGQLADQAATAKVKSA